MINIHQRMKRGKKPLLQPTYKLAQLAKASYTPYEVETPGFLYRADLSDSEMAVFEDSSAPNRAVVSFKGTDPNPFDVGISQWWNDMSNDALIIAGKYGSSKRVSESTQNVLELPYDEIILTGHSLGGATAYEVGKRTGLESYSFSTGSVPWNKTDYGEHYYHKQDLISSGIQDGHQSRHKIGDHVGFGIGGVVYDTLQAHDIDQFIGNEEDMQPVPWKTESTLGKKKEAAIPVQGKGAADVPTPQVNVNTGDREVVPSSFLRDELKVQRRQGIYIDFV